jgi:hypothetical protein
MREQFPFLKYKLIVPVLTGRNVYLVFYLGLLEIRFVNGIILVGGSAVFGRVEMVG